MPDSRTEIDGAAIQRVIAVDTSGNTPTALTVGADNQSDTANTAIGSSRLYAFDGTNWDRVRTTLSADGSTGGNLGAGLLVYDPVSATFKIVRTPSADGLAQTTMAAVGPMGFNGTTWDRSRSNYEVVILASTLESGTYTGSDLTNYNARGVILVADVTAVGGAGIFTFAIQMKDTNSGKYVSLLTSANVIGTSTNIYTVYPGATAAANLTVSMPLPRVWRVLATLISGTSLTFSLSAQYIV